MEQPPQQQPQPVEDEALKKSTDCVYFLASPLTCKKGSECEYRHSDVARMNPRDCYYWLSGNCLNPKCAFRHPPLEGLNGMQMPVSSGPVPPVLHVAAGPLHMPSGPIKQGVPCIFFQKGYCAKGDWCSFVHGPIPPSNKAPFIPEAASAEPATLNKAFVGADKFTQENKVGSTDVAKLAKAPFQTKSSFEVERAPSRVEAVRGRTLQASAHEFPENKIVGSVGNGHPHVQQPRWLDEPGSMNTKDAEEVSREPSPGFDVLVDDDRRDDDYYPGEDQYGMTREHEAGNKYETGHSSDYNRISEIANERYQDPIAYGSRDRFRDQYAWEHGALSDRNQGGSLLERRPHASSDARGQVDELDLRHRLSKNKKPNGLRSVISHEHTRDRRHSEDRRGFRRDEPHLPRQENPISSRLRGRIRLPGRSSSPTDKDDMVRSNDRRRSSPVRPGLSSQQGWVLDRIKGRDEDSFSNGEKSYRGMHPRRDASNADSANFAGPKSLSELKNKKNGDHATGYTLMDQQSLGKRKHLTPDEHKMSGDGVSFEGPKPLQEILKRKRGETAGSANGVSMSNNRSAVEGSNQNEIEKSVSAEPTDVQGTNEDPPAGNKTQAEEDVPAEDGEYQEYETYEEGVEYDYEQVEGEEYEMYDGENGEIEGEEEYQGEEENLGEEENQDEFANNEVEYSIQE